MASNKNSKIMRAEQSIQNIFLYIPDPSENKEMRFMWKSLDYILTVVNSEDSTYLKEITIYSLLMSFEEVFQEILNEKIEARRWWASALNNFTKSP